MSEFRFVEEKFIALSTMITINLNYLRRIAERTDVSSILREPKFLRAQKLFFDVVEDLGGCVDFEVADMREVHAVAALGDVKNVRVLDVGCGSIEPYVLEDTFRDRYPPFFAEMLASLGSSVTGVDIRPNPTAHYEHHVLDLTKKNWMTSLQPPYDVIACLSLFNAPRSPFENDPELCDRMMDDMHGLLASDGVLIVTLRDDLFVNKTTSTEQQAAVQQYVTSKQYTQVHRDGNSAWLQPL